MDLLVDCSSLPEQRLDVVPNPHQQRQQQQSAKSRTSSKKRKAEKHSSDEDEDDTKKRHRRTALQIERKFRCEVPLCGKAYGSEGALKMHVRLKHSDSIATKPTNTNEETTKPVPNTPQPTLNASTTPAVVSPSPTQLLPHVWTTTVYGDVLVPVVVEDLSPEAFQQPQIAQFYVTSPVSHVSEDLLLVEDTESEDIKELKDKFCYIPLLKLNIGLWQAESQCCGDLIAKFCYKERCIVWEIFDVGSLLRTVISFDNLNGVGLEFHADDTATLVMELLAPPTFFKGVLRAYESTLWTQISDFTEGMASTFRRHILHFSKRSLTDSIESIFQRDPRLQSLLLQGLPALKSPYFSQLETSPTSSASASPSSAATTLIDPSPSPPPSAAAVSFPSLRTEEPNWNPTTTIAVESDEKESDSSNHCSPIVITIESGESMVGEEEATDSLEVAVDELSKCALQSLQNYPQIIDSSLAHSKEAFELPCGHTQTIPLRDLLLHENFCATCKESYYFSFCQKKPVPVGRSWHCLVCNTCRNEKEWHCTHCGKCTTSPPSLWGNSVLCQKCCSAVRENASNSLVPQGLRRNYRRKRLVSTTSSGPNNISAPILKLETFSSITSPSTKPPSTSSTPSNRPVKPPPAIAPRIVPLPPILPAFKPEIKLSTSNNTASLPLKYSSNPSTSFIKPNLIFPSKTPINVTSK